MRRSPKLPRSVTSASSSDGSLWGSSPWDDSLSSVSLEDRSPPAHPSKYNFSPTPIFRPGRTRHSHSFGSSDNWRVSRTSTRPRRKSRAAGFCALTDCAHSPLRRPYSRAGKTLVLLITTRSSGRSKPGSSRKLRSRQLLNGSSLCRFKCSMRDAARSVKASCAMRSSGRS